MNLTLALDEKTVEKARQVAKAMGKSLNQLIREYLERIADQDDGERAAAELWQLWRSHTGRSGGKKFSRDEMHER